MPECPVCLDDIRADDTAFNHHVNVHFTEEEVAKQLGTGSSSSGGRKRKVSFEDGPKAVKECVVCGYPFQSLSVIEKQNHINACIDSEDRTDFEMEDRWTDEPRREEHDIEDITLETKGTLSVRSKAGQPADRGWDGPARPGGWSNWVSRKMDKGDVWWDPIEGSTDDQRVPPNWTPGALSALRQVLQSSSATSPTVVAVLSTEVPHICHSLRFDVGWGCGYRNALMAISAFILCSREYRSVFGRNANGSDPGVRRIQAWIEEAWDAGFDTEGRDQLKGKLLGTRKWIGTTELYAMFSFKGVPCQLGTIRTCHPPSLMAVDFPKMDPRARSSDATRPPHTSLVQWVKRYFGDNHQLSRTSAETGKTAYDVLMRTSEGGRDSSDKVLLSVKLPIIIQHSGHSRLIVGYEETPKATNLLMFDPGFSLHQEIRRKGLRAVQDSRPEQTDQPPRKPSHSSSHESLRFSRPYTNGASEPILFPENDIVLMEDEEMDGKGWVRKKIDKVRKMSDGVGENEGKKNVQDLLRAFRVSEDSLAKHKEYQLLVFTGGPLLSTVERQRRKVVSSIRVT